MIKLVIFDLDGVLASTSVEHFVAWKKIIKKEFSIVVSDSVEERTKGVARMDSLERILESIGKQHVSKKLKNRLAEEKNELYISLIRQFNSTNLFEGVPELFHHLKKQGIKIALGSASRNGTNIAISLGIYDSLDYIVNPANNKSKPHPDIFLDAMNHFGFARDECIGVEDAQAGIDSINSAGMISIGIVKESKLENYNFAFDTVKDIDLSIFNHS